MPRTPRPLRSHLLLLVAGTLLPVIIFGIIATTMVARDERESFERQIRRSTEIMANELEREFTSSIRTLEVIAQSDKFESGDIDHLRRDLREIAETQPTWLAIIVVDRNGQQLINTAWPDSTPLPTATEPESIEQVISTRAPAIGSLQRGKRGGRWGFPVRVPVLRGDSLLYVLTAVIPPDAVVDVITRRGPLRREWTRTVLDPNGIVVARTREPDRFLGRLATPTLREKMAVSREGFAPESTLDGAQVYLSYYQSPRWKWWALIATPAESIDAPVRDAVLTTAGIGGIMLLLSGLGALILSRRVARGIISATDAAEALAHGESPRTEPSRIEEVDRLHAALATSAELLHQRERERDEHLAAADAARRQAEEANRTKDAFLAMLGHELRNPLSPIILALELANSGPLGSTPELAVIERQVEHLTRLIDDLLDVSRITRGKVELRRAPTSMAEGVRKAIEMALPLIQERGHGLETDVAETITLDADPVRFAQVVGNLLTNAARYSPDGSVIRVLGRVEGEMGVLDVIDTGDGIDAELLPLLFDPFVQGPRDISRRQGGLGIGLSLVRSLVELHGGSVTAASDGPGTGSRFTIRLPLATSLAPEPATPAANGSAAPSTPRSYLVVDDNVDAGRLLAELLERHGNTVRLAHDAEEALELINGFRPEVAILDIGLPQMDGYTLAHHILKRTGSSSPMLIALTGYGQPEDVEKSRAAGFDLHLVKPADAATIIAAVEARAEGQPG